MGLDTPGQVMRLVEDKKRRTYKHEQHPYRHRQQDSHHRCFDSGFIVFGRQVTLYDRLIRAIFLSGLKHAIACHNT